MYPKSENDKYIFYILYILISTRLYVNLKLQKKHVMVLKEYQQIGSKFNIKVFTTVQKTVG